MDAPRGIGGGADPYSALFHYYSLGGNTAERGGQATCQALPRSFSGLCVRCRASILDELTHTEDRRLQPIGANNVATTDFFNNDDDDRVRIGY